MLKELLQYILGLTKPETVKVNEFEYSRDPLKVVLPPYAQAVGIKSLTSLVEYCKSNIDNLDPKSTLVSVPNYDEVAIFSSLDDFSNRENYLVAHCAFEPFKFGVYYPNENFVVFLQSLFKSSEDLNRVLAIASSITDINETKIEDNGLTQNVTAQTGLAKLGKTDVPNPVKLSPFRTFSEIEPVESQFIFRVRKGQGGQIECALFEADGGKWKEDTISRIRTYLTEKLDTKFTII